MRVILSLFLLLMLASTGFQFNVDFGSRLSGKNIMLYVSLMIIAYRMAREGRLRIELPSIQLCFVILIAYAIVSWWIAAFIIEYDRYPIFSNAVFLKILLLDYFLIFLAFFYGPRTTSEVMLVIKTLLVVVFVAHFFTVGEAWGLLPTNFVGERGSGRIMGLIGESNQYGAFTVLFLPALLAMAVNSGAVMRGFWLGGVFLSLLSLVLVASRGAILSAAVSIAVGLYVFRRHVSPGLVIRWAAIGGFVLVLSASIIGVRYGDVLYSRFIEQTLDYGNLSNLSQGRTEIWATALDKMLEHPITLLTGFGWRVYWSLPNFAAPHNTYLNYWFNLGLPGVLSLIAIFAIGATSAYRASLQAANPAAFQLAAFVLAQIAGATALFFGEWYEPWPFFWAYFGLSMRLVVLAGESGAVVSAPSPTREPAPAGVLSTSRRDKFGWSARTD